MKVLVISRNQLEIERVPLSRSTMTIGRSPTNDVVLRAPKVAACHFLLEWVGVGGMDLGTSDWSIMDISRLSDEGNAGLMLDEGSVTLDGFRFELREDKLEARPDISGRVLEFTHEQKSTQRTIGDFSHQFLELMVVRRDSGSVDDVIHLKPEKLKRDTFPLKLIPHLQIRREGNLLKIILSKMPDAQVYNRGQKIPFPNGAIVLGAEDLVQLIWGRYQLFLRYVTRQKVPFVGRASLIDPLLQRLLIVAVLIYLVLFGLILSGMHFEDQDKEKLPPRVATVEIKTVAEPKPPAPTPPKEIAPPKVPTSTQKTNLDAESVARNQKTQQPRLGIPKQKSSPKPGEAAAPKYVNDTKSLSKIGLNSPAKVANTNTVGMLGGFAKANNGPGVSSDKILNQGVVPDTLSSPNDAAATIKIKTPPAGVLGTGDGGDPRSKEKGGEQLAQATTSFANSEKYNPKSSGPIAREGAKGLGWEAGTSLSKGGAGVGGGSLSGRGDIGSIDVGSLTVEGGLDRETVRRVINANRGLLRTCYERALLTNPKVSGRILFRWQISPSGPVITTQMIKSTMGNPSVESCVLGVIKGMQFPEASNGKPTVVIYPFEFRPNN